MNKNPVTRDPWSVTRFPNRPVSSFKYLIVILAVLTSLGSPITSHAVSLLSVSNDGGASNRTASSAYISGNIGVANALGGIITNIFYDGLTNAGTCSACYSRATTNVSHQGTGLVQTNLPFASGGNYAYIFSTLDKSGQVFAAAAQLFSTPSGGISSNANSELGTVAIDTNTGARTVTMPAGSSIFITGSGTLGTGGGTTNLGTIAITGPQPGNAGGATITNVGTLQIEGYPSGGTKMLLLGIASDGTSNGVGVIGSSLLHQTPTGGDTIWDSGNLDTNTINAKAQSMVNSGDVASVRGLTAGNTTNLIQGIVNTGDVASVRGLTAGATTNLITASTNNLPAKYVLNDGGTATNLVIRAPTMNSNRGTGSVFTVKLPPFMIDVETNGGGASLPSIVLPDFADINNRFPRWIMVGMDSAGHVLIPIAMYRDDMSVEDVTAVATNNFGEAVYGTGVGAGPFVGAQFSIGTAASSNKSPLFINARQIRHDQGGYNQETILIHTVDYAGSDVPMQFLIQDWQNSIRFGLSDGTNWDSYAALTNNATTGAKEGPIKFRLNMFTGNVEASGNIITNGDTGTFTMAQGSQLRVQGVLNLGTATLVNNDITLTAPGTNTLYILNGANITNALTATGDVTIYANSNATLWSWVFASTAARKFDNLTNSFALPPKSYRTVVRQSSNGTGTPNHYLTLTRGFQKPFVTNFPMTIGATLFTNPPTWGFAMKLVAKIENTTTLSGSSSCVFTNLTDGTAHTKDVPFGVADVVTNTVELTAAPGDVLQINGVNAAVVAVDGFALP